jgi:hypothetical protein
MRKNFGDVTHKNTRHPSASFRSRPIESSVVGSLLAVLTANKFVPAVTSPRSCPRHVYRDRRGKWSFSTVSLISSQFRAGSYGSKAPIPSLAVEWQLMADTVEKLVFLSRSQFLRQQAAFKKNALRVSAEKLTFLCAATVANWRWQRVAISALHNQSLVF